jgi:hypothetical protein
LNLSQQSDLVGVARGVLPPACEEFASLVRRKLGHKFSLFDAPTLLGQVRHRVRQRPLGVG